VSAPVSRRPALSDPLCADGMLLTGTRGSGKSLALNASLSACVEAARATGKRRRIYFWDALFRVSSISADAAWWEGAPLPCGADGGPDAVVFGPNVELLDAIEAASSDASGPPCIIHVDELGYALASAERKGDGTLRHLERVMVAGRTPWPGRDGRQRAPVTLRCAAQRPEQVPPSITGAGMGVQYWGPRDARKVYPGIPPWTGGQPVATFWDVQGRALVHLDIDAGPDPVVELDHGGVWDD